MVQIIILLIIVALGFLVFRIYPIKRARTIDIVLSSIFIMITIVCKRFLTIMIPFFGLESFKIGLDYIPLMIAGFYLEPAYAYLIGLCSDLLGLIIVPTGFPFFGFTLTTILVSTMPSLIMSRVGSVSESKIRYVAQGLIIALALGGSLYISGLDTLTISETAYALTFIQKMILIVICWIIVIAFVVIIYVFRKRIGNDESKSFSTWILCVTLVEIVCTLCLTPLWLDIMYGIPFIVSLCMRIVKECAILPIEIFLGYMIIKVMNRLLVNVKRS